MMTALSLHKKLEDNVGLLIFGILLVSSIGGLVQILPSIFEKSLSAPGIDTQPYDPVALTGRDIYIREGCNVCHSQQVRPIAAEIERYGPYSRAGEFVYDRPFLWGSKRTGPDLHRIGGKYSDDWHRIHLISPRRVVKGSIMPAYPWLADNDVDSTDIKARLKALRRLGHPYSDEDIASAPEKLRGMKEVDALVHYLQKLGTQGL